MIDCTDSTAWNIFFYLCPCIFLFELAIIVITLTLIDMIFRLCSLQGNFDLGSDSFAALSMLYVCVNLNLTLSSGSKIRLLFFEFWLRGGIGPALLCNCGLESFCWLSVVLQNSRYTFATGLSWQTLVQIMCPKLHFHMKEQALHRTFLWIGSWVMCLRMILYFWVSGVWSGCGLIWDCNAPNLWEADKQVETRPKLKF